MPEDLQKLPVVGGPTWDNPGFDALKGLQVLLWHAVLFQVLEEWIVFDEIPVCGHLTNVISS